MDRIINYLLLTIIFVFDPLAIALVVAANFAFEQIRPKTKKNLYGEKVIINENEGANLDVQAKYTDWEDEAEERMNIIGQNGNDGIHYDQKESLPLKDLNKEKKQLKK